MSFKRIFEIEFDEDLGLLWMNEDNLLLCIDSYCKPGLCKVKDITDKLTFDKLQEEQKAWADRNFSKDTPFWHPLLGVVEEVGELAHVILKEIQNIRNVSVEKEKDAVGDIVIYLVDFCSRRGYKLSEIVNNVWNEVKKRDWKKNSKTGQ